VRFTVEVEPWELPVLPVQPGDGEQARIKMTKIYFSEEPIETPVYVRDQLHAGDRFSGPAIITEYSATTVIPPLDSVFVDEHGSLVIEVAAG
jgi:N-methylhydantoinase A/oxoprolinase/acetone carboxylase beta subunit